MNKKLYIPLGIISLIMVIGIAGMLLEKKPDAPSAPVSSEAASSMPTDTPFSEQSTGVSSLADTRDSIEFFRKTNGKVILPAELKYPDSAENPSSSYVAIGKRFKMSFTKNWITNIDGNTITAVHTTGPSLVLKQTALADKYSIDVVNTKLSEFVSACGNSTAVANDIFYSGKVIGRLASSTVIIDGDEYIMDAAIFLCEKEVYQLVCVYPPETEETVIALYNGISFSDRNLTLK